MRSTCFFGKGQLLSFSYPKAFALILGFLTCSSLLSAQSFVYHHEGNYLEIDVFYDSSVPISELSLTIPLPEGYVWHPDSYPSTDWGVGWFCSSGNCSDTYTTIPWKKEFDLHIEANEPVLGFGKLLRVKGIITEVDDIITKKAAPKGRELLLYPNPGSGKFVLSFADAEEQLLESTWINMQGRIVLKESHMAGSQVLQVRDLARGIYNLSVKTNLGQYQQRVQVQ